MAEEATIEAPNLMREKYAPISGTWYEWVITAPGYRVFTPVSTTMAAFGGGVMGLVVGAALTMLTRSTFFLWAGLISGPFLGAGYAKLVNRLVGTDRLIADGHAVRIKDIDRNTLVVGAVRRNAPGYFAAARRAAELDAIEKRLKGRDLPSAEHAVLDSELKEGTEELHLMLSHASLVHAAALLDPSDPAIRAAGHLTAAMYEELQQGKAASYDEDL